jgi:type IV pilus assembly protein PilF
MKRLPIIFTSVAALFIAACSSTTTVETKVPDRAFGADARKRATVHTELGSAYFQERKFAVALEEANLAVKDDASFAPGHTLRALIYMEIKQPEEARASFARALAITPNDSELLNSVGWFECQLGDVDKAYEYFNRVKRDPLYATPYKPLLNEGLCMRKQNRNDDAKISLMQAMRIRADLPSAHYAMAEIFFSENNMREAEKFVNNTILLGNPNADTLLLGARVARGLGDRSTQDSYVEQLTKRFPGSNQAKAALTL